MGSEKIKPSTHVVDIKKIYQHKELNIKPADLDQYSVRLKRPK